MVKDEKVIEITEQIFAAIGVARERLGFAERKLNELQVLTGEV